MLRAGKQKPPKMASHCRLGFMTGLPFIDGASPCFKRTLEGQHTTALLASLEFGAAAFQVRASSANLQAARLLLFADAFNALFEYLAGSIKQAFGHGRHRGLFFRAQTRVLRRALKNQFLRPCFRFCRHIARCHPCALRACFPHGH